MFQDGEVEYLNRWRRCFHHMPERHVQDLQMIHVQRKIYLGQRNICSSLSGEGYGVRNDLLRS